MQTLQIEPTAPFPIRPGPTTVVLVGCGGTGSHIAQALARIAAHLAATGGERLRLIFCDGDTVETKNVGRQLFTPSDVGHNKAQALATRFNHLFGLAIEALPEMATVDRLAALGGITKRAGRAEGGVGVLVGAVDTATARRSLHSALDQRCWNLWLDCGNHEFAGQVCVGSTTMPTLLEHAIKAGLCARLPAPSLVYPDLLAATPRRRRADCAAAMEDNAQSLVVNQIMAAVATEYLYKILLQRQLTTFATAVDLTTLAMRSTPITAGHLRRVMTEALRRTEATTQKEAA